MCPTAVETTRKYLERRIDQYFRKADEILARNNTEDYLDLPLAEFQKHHRYIERAVELSIVLGKLNGN